MSKIEELDRLTKTIKDHEIRFKAISNNVEMIDKELLVLEPRKTELEKNIQFHKKPGTVPLANEHRKAKAELSKIKARLILINDDRKRSVDTCSQIQEIIEKFKKDHLELLKTSDDNVIELGGRRGKK